MMLPSHNTHPSPADGYVLFVEDPIWEAAFEGPMPPVAFYHLSGRGRGERLVAWNTSKIGWKGDERSRQDTPAGSSTRVSSR
jgi:hypothetical protein